MKNHLKNNYCESLKAKGELDNCDEAKALEKIDVSVSRVPGYPFDSGNEWGKPTQCGNDGIVTEQCGGGGSFGNCNGHQTYGRCERFDLNESKKSGYW